MPALRDIVTAVACANDGSVALEYKKASHATGEGDRYEERVLALVFLRCLRHRLHFQLSANNGDAGKFDDVVLAWRPKGISEAHTLLVQLKHKTSTKYMSLDSDVWLSKSDFSLNKYCTSYVKIRKSLEMEKVAFVLLTNACLGESSLDMFERQDVGSVSGLDLLHAGGDLYKLNLNNKQVCEAVHGNASFVDHFYLMCRQRNSDEIVEDIYGELKVLLGAGDQCRSICDNLCKNVRGWMNHESVCLTKGWSKWQGLVDEYVKNNLTECRMVTTKLKYRSVADVRDYVESCNPAWIRPPERGTAALPATKLHQALAGQPHIMVPVGRFRELEQQIVRCWSLFCRWLVIVDDDREDNSDIFDELVNNIQSECHLVIVSSRENNSFVDTCQSSDVSDDSWNDCLDVSVRLNGDRYECRLRDLVTGVDALKSLLDGEPALLLALARLSQPLRMGQELDTLPTYYIPRKLVERRQVNELFSIAGGNLEYEREQLQVLDAASKIVIVEGRPGVGKSKMLSHVAKQIKERDSACWVLRINLLEFYTVLDKRDSGGSALEDILWGTLYNKDDLGRLEYALLRLSLLQSSRVVCLVDGFDEVCPDYVNKCLEVLLLLAPCKGKLLVTTRPGLTDLLESEMGVLSHSLRPFRKSELEDFFIHHPSWKIVPWTNAPPLSGLSKNLRNFLKIPLFAEMFVNLSQETAETCDIVTLYEAFFQSKFKRLYEEKLGDNLSAPGKRREVKEAQKRHEQQLMLLAASVLLRSTDVPAMPSFDSDYFVKAGIVYEFADGKPVFLHRTFAEHFLAKWCFEGDGERNRAAVYREAYRNGTLEFFLESFDRRAVCNRPLLEAVLYGDVDKVEVLLAEGADPRQTDACGRNALHLAAALDPWISLCLLSRLCRHVKEDMLSAEDDLFGWTPMRYAVERGRWVTVSELVDAGGDLSDLWNFHSVLHYPPELQAMFDQDRYRALYQYVSEVYHPSQKQWAPLNLVRLPFPLLFPFMRRHWLENIDSVFGEEEDLLFPEPSMSPNFQRKMSNLRDAKDWEEVYLIFAESLASANIPRKMFDLIAAKAWEKAQIQVCDIFLSFIQQQKKIRKKVIKVMGRLYLSRPSESLQNGREPRTASAEEIVQRENSSHSNSCSPSCATEVAPPDAGSPGGASGSQRHV